MQEWKECEGGECPECGDRLEILTSSTTDAYFDRDDVRCPECDYTSCWSVDEDSNGDYYGFVQ
jgi:ssDNA-binding Zn-finger/Zn-ribbon topoisomerase 1